MAAAGEMPSTKSSATSPGISAISAGAAVERSMPDEDGSGDENLEEIMHRNGEEDDVVIEEAALVTTVDVKNRCRNRFVRSLLVILDRSSPAVFSVSKHIGNGTKGVFNSGLPSSFRRKQPEAQAHLKFVGLDEVDGPLTKM